MHMESHIRQRLLVLHVLPEGVNVGVMWIPRDDVGGVDIGDADIMRRG